MSVIVYYVHSLKATDHIHGIIPKSASLHISLILKNPSSIAISWISCIWHCWPSGCFALHIQSGMGLGLGIHQMSAKILSVEAGHESDLPKQTKNKGFKFQQVFYVVMQRYSGHKCVDIWCVRCGEWTSSRPVGWLCSEESALLDAVHLHASLPRFVPHTHPPTVSVHNSVAHTGEQVNIKVPM